MYKLRCYLGTDNFEWVKDEKGEDVFMCKDCKITLNKEGKVINNLKLAKFQMVCPLLILNLIIVVIVGYFLIKHLIQI